MRLLTDEKQQHFLFYNYYFWVFTCTAIQSSFLNLFLNNAGMSQELIGVLNGIIQILGLIIYPLWGKVADKASSVNVVLVFGLIASTVLLVAFYFAKSIFLLSLLLILFSSVHNPLQGLYETITVTYTNRNGWNYGPIRMTGTISYAIMALVAGKLLAINEGLIFPVFIVAMALTTISGMLLPKARKASNTNDKPKENVYVLLKDKRIRNVLILYGVYMLGSSISGTYYGIYMTQLGGDYSLVGIAQMILALSEIPFHIGPGGRWMKKIGVQRSMLLVSIFGTIRWLIVGLCKNKYVLMATMAFNGIMLVPTIVGLVQYIYDCAPENLKASAQTGLKSAFQVVAQLIASFGGGALVGFLNARNLPGIKILFLSLSPISLIVSIVMIISLRKIEKDEKYNS